MTLSYDYWKDREEKARQQTIKDEEERIKEIEEIYKRMFDEIQRDIDSFFAKYAADEGISIAEAKKRVSKLDMEEFERKAKEYVKNKDFSDQANEEMKLYNLTMKVNRLEMLKAKIGLELVNGYQEIEDYMGEALTETTMKEIERHAGILGKTVGDNQDYAEDIVDASFHNATWSERIWANQDRLKHDLGKLLTSGLIQGKNPRELARDLQKSMNVSKYDAERLMRTEMCRVQIDASLREIEANGFTQFIFIADSGGSRTCEQCKALDGKTFSLKDGKVGVNLPPLHPNCRCSIAGHVDDEEFFDFMDELGVEFTDEELEFLGRGRKGDSNERHEDVVTNNLNADNAGALKNLISNNTLISNQDNNEVKRNFDPRNSNIKSGIFYGKNGIIKLGKKEDLSDFDLTNIREGQQNKHIRGTHEYRQRESQAKYPPSIITITIDAVRKLVNEFAGKGINQYDRHGNWMQEEVIITNSTEVGEVVNNKNGERRKTTVFKIHYSKKGVHIVPDYPSKKGET